MIVAQCLLCLAPVEQVWCVMAREPEEEAKTHREDVSWKSDFNEREKIRSLAGESEDEAVRNKHECFPGGVFLSS